MHKGMHDLVSHLIEVHGRRKIAFIRGLETSQDAEERYLAYVETLNQYHIPVDPNLIVSGNFQRNSGTAAIKELINSRRMGFDALVSANDNMAIGAMQALQSNGVRVPEDVIVAGFDDIEETRAITPSLTTVRTPWRLLGSKSIDLVLMKLANEPMPEQILLETELICRQSCGCQNTMMQIRATKSANRLSIKSVEVVDNRANSSLPGQQTCREISMAFSQPWLLFVGSIWIGQDGVSKPFSTMQLFPELNQVVLFKF